MSLKAVLTAEEFEALEEGVKSLYEEKDGKHILQVEGIDDHPSIAALRNGHKRSKEERDAAKTKLSNYEKRFGTLLAIDEDVDLSEADESMLENIAKWSKGEIQLTVPSDDDEDDDKKKKNQDIDIEKIKDMARKPLQRDLEAALGERDTLKSQLEQIIVGQALTEALVDAKVMPVYMGPLKSHFSKMVKLSESEDGDVPVAMIEGEYGEQPVSNFIKDWSQTDEGKAFIDAGGNSGGGSNSSRNNGSGPKVSNPWAKETYNVTEQMRLYKEDPEKARRMAKEHGVTI